MQRDLPIGMIASLAICTVLYIAVAGVLTGMVHWQQINIEAPVAQHFWIAVCRLRHTSLRSARLQD